jgi:shikimate dehydrogenase
MFPEVNDTPLQLKEPFHETALQMVYDLIYNPSPTLLMRQAEALGAKVKNGLEMLQRQAELSWRIWGL